MTVVRKLGLLTALAAIVSLAPGGTAHASTVSSQSGPIHTAAARSVTVQFINSYTGPLTLHSTHLSHGKWVVRPPNTIDVGSTAVWASVSNGIFTGTEGE